MTPGRFDYVQYDEESCARQEIVKAAVKILEGEINAYVECGRSKALALTSLEEVYMWVGKGIRNDQVTRTQKIQLQEQRTNS